MFYFLTYTQINTYESINFSLGGVSKIMPCKIVSFKKKYWGVWGVGSVSDC